MTAAPTATRTPRLADRDRDEVRSLSSSPMTTNNMGMVAKVAHHRGATSAMKVSDDVRNPQTSVPMTATTTHWGT